MLMPFPQQMEEFSRAWVAKVAAVAGCPIGSVSQDLNSNDLIIKDGNNTGAQIDAQLKCTGRADFREEAFTFDLPVKNYNDLRLVATVQRLLIVVVVPHRVEDWVITTPDVAVMQHAAYWRNLVGEPATENQHTVRIRMSRAQQFTPMALREMMTTIASKGAL